MRLGTWLPSFAQAARALAYFTGVEVSEPTARRRTEAAGAAAVALHDAEVDRLERERPTPPAGPPVQQLSADGAMVPLVGGEWAEVKTAAVGVVAAARGADGVPAVRTRAVSYVARLADCDAFGRAALPELHRRGTETAGALVAVTDGGEWL
ncbi:MAG TPA: ISKra4 family transposase, partial [Actinomycetes bacterium]|nr:ISKra4 family transposase [Actinomycetes bacterium]